MKSILDPSFVYRNSAATDIRKTFEEARSRAESECCDPWFDDSAFKRQNVKPLVRLKTA